MSLAAMIWRNPPAKAAITGETLTLTTGRATDVWRKTHYGFVRDKGRFLHHPVTGDFSAEVTITAQHEALYDQAGLMLRINAACWIKAGIEYTDGQPSFSTVVTDDRSDWSIVALPFAADRIRLRLTPYADAVGVQIRCPDAGWMMTRFGYLDPGLGDVGIMACSPEIEGFVARCQDLTRGPAIDRALHD